MQGRLTAGPCALGDHPCARQRVDHERREQEDVSRLRGAAYQAPGETGSSTVLGRP